MERWNGRVALVTGASVGIGAAICRELVKYGMVVVGCARNVKKIQELAEEDAVLICPGKMHAIKCDLTEETEILNMFSEIRQKFGRVDVVINNAGFSTDSPLLSGKTSDWRSMLEVNVLALCICNREAIKIMQEKGIDDGQIINISSMGGHRLPASSQMFGVNFYCGTKFMVRALTEGLRKEVKGTNMHIRVASISPGMVETEFFPRLYKDRKDLSDAFYGSIECLQANDIADAVAYILKCPPHVDINDILLRPSISPGMVETEFLPRLYKDRKDLSDAFYGSIECLQANDIADAVAYILKSPPHVDINDILLRPVEQSN